MADYRETAGEPAMTVSNAWKDHKGSEQPVSYHVYVECWTRCGFRFYALSQDVDWHKTDSDYDVMMYRIAGYDDRGDL